MKSLNKIVYGSEIKRCIQKDDFLKKASEKDGVCVNITTPLSDSDRDFWEMVCFLKREGLITERQPRVYHITEEGRSFLALGGYVMEAKRGKMPVFAFRISIIAIAISLVSLVVGLFVRLS